MPKINKLKITIDDKTLVDIDLDICEITALVGASGSGKTLTLKALLDLLPSSMQKDLEISSDYPLKRGKTVAFVPQNPFTSLSPMSTIGKQFHLPDHIATAHLKSVGLDAWVLDRFPSELSGGQLQRVVIAIALSQNPKLLLLDEPTTALDELSKNEIITLLKNIADQEKITMLLVTHDMSLVATLAKFVAVIDSSKIIEYGTTDEILKHPKNSKTQELIESNFKLRSWRK